MPILVTRARRDTPGCSRVLHLNNAGSSLPPQPVVDAVIAHLQLEAGIGGYEAEAKADASIERTYEAVAELLGCATHEVALTESATTGWQAVFSAIPLTRGDRVLIGRADYASNSIAILQRCRRTGAKLGVIPDDEYGQTSVDALRAMIDDRVKLIALTHVPTNGGLVNPAEAVGAVARAHNITYLLDACQSVGQMPIDVEKIGCDALTFAGRKYVRGPRGTGALYVRRTLLETLEPLALDLRGATWTSADQYEICADARRFETWESCVAARIGLGVAIDYALRLGLDDIATRVTMLAQQLRTQLQEIPGVVVEDLGERKCGIVTFTVEGWDPERIKTALAADKVNVSVSPRHFTLLDMDARGLAKLTRASIHYYNTEEELERFAALIGRIAT